MKNRISKTVYWLDRHDKIIRVCDFWDQFALENDGDNVISSRVVGKHVLDFVHGDTTRMWIETLLQLSRLRGAYLERPYRCDSPDMRRYMKLGIFPRVIRYSAPGTYAGINRRKKIQGPNSCRTGCDGF